MKVEQKQNLVTQICKMYHTASLYHEDVMDSNMEDSDLVQKA